MSAIGLGDRAGEDELCSLRCHQKFLCLKALASTPVGKETKEFTSRATLLLHSFGRESGCKSIVSGAQCTLAPLLRGWGMAIFGMRSPLSSARLEQLTYRAALLRSCQGMAAFWSGEWTRCGSTDPSLYHCRFTLICYRAQDASISAFRGSTCTSLPGSGCPCAAGSSRSSHQQAAFSSARCAATVKQLTDVSCFES